MNISKKDASLLVGLAGVLFVIAIWYLVASPLQTKTKTLETENTTLKTQAELYQSVNANLATYEDGIAKMEKSIAEIGEHYPVNIIREDEIMFLSNMEDTYPKDVAVETITMDDVEEIYASTAAATTTAATTTDATTTTTDTTNVTADTPAVPVRLFRQPTEYNFRATYTGLKDMITYFVENSNKKSIEEFVVQLDTETGNLTGTAILGQYYMTGIDKEYQGIKIPTVRKGVDDVFHTVGGAAGVKASASNPTLDGESAEGAEGAEEAENAEGNTEEKKAE